MHNIEYVERLWIVWQITIINLLFVYELFDKMCQHNAISGMHIVAMLKDLWTIQHQIAVFRNAMIDWFAQIGYAKKTTTCLIEYPSKCRLWKCNTDKICSRRVCQGICKLFDIMLHKIYIHKVFNVGKCAINDYNKVVHLFLMWWNTRNSKTQYILHQRSNYTLQCW